MDQLPSEHTMTDEVIEELPKTVKEELPEEKIQDGIVEFALKVETIKEEALDSYGTDHFNAPTFEFPQNRCKSESKYNKYSIKVLEGDNFIGTPQFEADITHKFGESPLHCKEEEIDIKYEDLRTELTEHPTNSRCDTENDRREVKKEVKLYERGESLNKPKQEGNHEQKLSLVAHVGIIMKEQALDFYGTDQLDASCDFTGTQRFETDITHQFGGYPVNYKEVIDIKCEDLKTELTDSRCDTENDRKEIKLYEREESLNKPKQTGNHEHKLSLELKTKLEAELYKCHECSYATKHAGDLKKHMFVHKATSEVDLHECHECSFATKHARSLKRHRLVHKTKSEVNLHKCLECSFASKQAENLKTHMLGHKAKSEVDLYKCQDCLYTTKQAGSLKKHMLVHKAKSEVSLYKCHECSYAAKHAEYLKMHMLTHKAKSEIVMYKCHECSFATKHGISLKWHMLTHKAKSEIYMYECNECSFATKHARSVKRHMLTHKTKSEVALYKCRECSYAAKLAYHLKTHMLIHKSKSEVDLHKCKKCSFATKHAKSLKKHMSMH